MNITHPGFQVPSPLHLPEDEVHVWRLDLEAMQSGHERWLKLLSPDELVRASRFHFDRDRQRYAAGRAWLRNILAAYTGRDPAELKFSYSRKEKPSLNQPENNPVMFNVSHSGSVALLGFTRRREIGVDIEEIRANSDLDAIARRFFSGCEQQDFFPLPAEKRVPAFFRIWTRKEAYIKATGDGLSLPLSQFDVSLDPGSSDALISTRPESTEAGRWRLMEIGAGTGYAAALCVRGRDWKLRSWTETSD
ncbi:MAG TPA: 4'-phosphopantetheinyl transferase superfamily protein [Candidatus Binatia bacterium]|nr:4'-phosphopantetheinyl transferase superfamily protein [Candidatus Binatia bacterium]